MVTVRIQAKDGNIVRIETNLLNLIPTLHRKISGESDEQDGKLYVEINSEVLQEIIAWCEYHNRCPTEKDNKREGNRSSWELCEWDRGFFLENRQKFDELVDAAIVLDMEHLCDACSIYVTERFREFTEYGQLLGYQHSF
ncbi:unnamed protein product [Rodentolepis nana]|uniref:Skp1_POZ domain-containing protein n=1 Tax=Rodentolepis nana TaxID=102285 RepID=A0A0R3TVC8_RODNA|nr:unnamed protein product [Rodentolepis nana]